jgi:hypothetical protein
MVKERKERGSKMEAKKQNTINRRTSREALRPFRGRYKSDDMHKDFRGEGEEVHGEGWFLIMEFLAST